MEKCWWTVMVKRAMNLLQVRGYVEEQECEENSKLHHSLIFKIFRHDLHAALSSGRQINVSRSTFPQQQLRWTRKDRRHDGGQACSLSTTVRPVDGGPTWLRLSFYWWSLMGKHERLCESSRDKLEMCFECLLLASHIMSVRRSVVCGKE